MLCESKTTVGIKVRVFLFEPYKDKPSESSRYKTVFLYQKEENRSLGKLKNIPKVTQFANDGRKIKISCSLTLNTSS